MHPVVILGGGPAGLAAAHKLMLHGISTLVLEKERVIGGLCRTISHNGFRFDIGPHRWFTKNKELDHWFKQLMQDELTQVNRRTGIYFEGKYFDYPLEIKGVLKTLGFLTSLHVIASYLISILKRVIKRDQPENMEDAYVRQFGKKLYEIFFKGYSEKIWEDLPRSISADWVDQRTFGLSVTQIIRKALFKSGEERKGLVEVRQFLHPRFGYGRISQRMAEEIEAQGGKVLVNHAASSVEMEDRRVKGVHYRDGNGERQFVEAGAIISTIPLTVLARILEPPVPQDVKAAAESLKFRNLITVNIMINRERVMKDTWIYINDKQIPFARVHEPRNFSEEMSPLSQTSLVAELFCSSGDNFWNQSDSSLSAMAIYHFCHTLPLIREADVLDTFVCRIPNAYPVYDLNYKNSVKVIRDYLATIPNLIIAGRGGTFHYHTSDLSIEMGFQAAEDFLRTASTAISV